MAEPDRRSHGHRRPALTAEPDCKRNLACVDNADLRSVKVWVDREGRTVRSWVADAVTGADLPDSQDSYQRLITDGQAASLANATEAHHTRDFPAPVVPS